jgi:hypothetical protein
MHWNITKLLQFLSFRDLGPFILSVLLERKILSSKFYVYKPNSKHFIIWWKTDKQSGKSVQAIRNIHLEAFDILGTILRILFSFVKDMLISTNNIQPALTLQLLINY